MVSLMAVLNKILVGGSTISPKVFSCSPFAAESKGDFPYDNAWTNAKTTLTIQPALQGQSCKTPYPSPNSSN